ncbi:MAG: DUF1592 domain-containing protein [Polyangiaceae bacterium]|nr:DUF1592 domain-containing protein [Polyangiaceae bacterium]
MRREIYFQVFVSVAALACSLGCQEELPTERNGGASAPGVASGEAPSNMPGVMAGTGGVSGGAPGVPGGSATCALPPQRYSRLTPEALESKTVSLFPNTSGIALRVLPYSPTPQVWSHETQALSVPQQFFDEWFRVTEDLAANVDRDPGIIDPCLRQSIGDDACVRSAMSAFLERAWERPASADELDGTMQFFAGEVAAAGGATALRQTVRKVLLSPFYLFRSEVGVAGADGQYALSPWEVAGALSYFLTGKGPDAELVQAAKGGQLGVVEVRSEAQRLLASAEASPGLVRFFDELLGLQRVSTANRPQVSDAVIQSLPEETHRFISAALWQKDGLLRTLLTGNFSMVTPELASYYGATAPQSGWAEVALPDYRRGILTQGSFLTAHPGITSRGVTIRNKLLCLELPPPPPNVNQDLTKSAGSLEAELGRKPNRAEVRAKHMSEASCAACHSQVDPMGYPLDMFDNAGAYRADVNGEALDLEGAIVGSGDVDGKVTGPAELTEKLAASGSVARCFAQQLYSFASARSVGPSDSCAVSALADGFAKSGGDIRQLIVSYVTSDAFLKRSPMQETP